MAMAVASHRGHVAILTYPFTSHPLTFLNLARQLATTAADVQFSYFNTAKSNRFFLSIQNTDLPINIKAYNVEDGIPKGFDHSEFTKNPHQEFIFYVDGLAENLKRAMREAEKETGGRITGFLADAFLSFSVCKIAEELNIPWVVLWSVAPHALPAFLQLELISELYTKAQPEDDLPRELLQDLVPGMSPIRFRDLPTATYMKLPISAMFLSMTGTIRQASALLLTSHEEINPTTLTNYFKSNFKKLLYVGNPNLPVLPKDMGEDATGCLSWLAGKKAASVAYICFGTVVKLSQMEIVALAEALEESGVPFLWSLKDNLKDQLPDGFLERISMLGTGKIAPWVPQSRVLSHPSTGVHITHCGHNSICESILGGVPMICRSDWADSHLNAKMVEEVWGIGVRVEDGAITRSGMVKNLETIFHHEKGKKTREAIASLKELLIKATGPNGAAAKDFKTLLQIITSKE